VIVGPVQSAMPAVYVWLLVQQSPELEGVSFRRRLGVARLYL
jgi:hypothetical protein